MPWKDRYFKLVQYTQELLSKIKEIEIIQYRINSHAQESNRLDLRERNKIRLMRLKKDCTVVVEYNDSYRNVENFYKANTLIQCSANGHVYLDDDGDGNIYFPTEQLEEIEIDTDNPLIDWNSVVWQG